MKIIMISALWCPSCIIMNNILNEIQSNYNLNIKRYDYDVDFNIVKEYNIEKILPVLIFLDESGKEIKRIIGEKSKKELIKEIEVLK